jgi:hypothetical protein
LQIIFGAHGVESSTPYTRSITYTVDGGTPITVDECCFTQTLWRGRSGPHTVEIEPTGDVVITHFVVRDDPRVTPAMIIAGGLLLTIAWHSSRRRSLLDEPETTDGE